jgi:hypothetical protein
VVGPARASLDKSASRKERVTEDFAYWFYKFNFKFISWWFFQNISQRKFCFFRFDHREIYLERQFIIPLCLAQTNYSCYKHVEAGYDLEKITHKQVLCFLPYSHVRSGLLSVSISSGHDASHDLFFITGLRELVASYVITEENERRAQRIMCGYKEKKKE